MVRLGSFLTAAIAAGALASPAGAASIYYGCGNDVCRVAPDGSGNATVASGRPYRGPSVSLDGQHLAWIEPTANLFTGTGAGADPVGPITRYATVATMSADGSQVLVGETATPSFRICVYAVSGGDCQEQAGGGTAGWGPDGRVLLTTYDFGDPAFNGKDRVYENKVCLLKPGGGETGGECEQTYAYDADHRLADPALSPDGTTVAVEQSPWDNQDATQIALYDVATTQLKSVVTAGPGDGTPRWSPDGSMIAFTRDGGIWVVRADGTPGSERRIATGDSPSWANVDAVAAPKVAVKARQRGATVHGTITVPTADSALRTQLIFHDSTGTFVVGASTRRSVPAGRRPFAATLTSKVQHALRKGKVRRIPLTVRLTLTPPGGAPVTVTRRVTLQLR